MTRMDYEQEDVTCLCLSPSGWSIDSCFEESVILCMKCLSLHRLKNRSLSMNDFYRRYVPINFCVIREALRCWTSLSVGFPFPSNLFQENDVFYLDVPQLDPVSVARACIDGSCSDRYFTKTLVRAIAIWDLRCNILRIFRISSLRDLVLRKTRY